MTVGLATLEIHQSLKTQDSVHSVACDTLDTNNTSSRRDLSSDELY